MFRAGLLLIIRKYYFVYTAMVYVMSKIMELLKLLKYIYLVVKKRKTFCCQ